MAYLSIYEGQARYWRDFADTLISLGADEALIARAEQEYLLNANAAKWLREEALSVAQDA